MEKALRQRLEALPPAGSRRTSPRPSPPRLRSCRPDRRVLGAPGDPDLRGAADRPGRGQGGAGCRLRAPRRDGAEAVQLTGESYPERRVRCQRAVAADGGRASKVSRGCVWRACASHLRASSRVGGSRPQAGPRGRWNMGWDSVERNSAQSPRRREDSRRPRTRHPGMVGRPALGNGQVVWMAIRTEPSGSGYCASAA